MRNKFNKRRRVSQPVSLRGKCKSVKRELVLTSHREHARAGRADTGGKKCFYRQELECQTWESGSHPVVEER